jgi:hypothetical protein
MEIVNESIQMNETGKTLKHEQTRQKKLLPIFLLLSTEDTRMFKAKASRFIQKLVGVFESLSSERQRELYQELVVILEDRELTTLKMKIGAELAKELYLGWK